MKLRDIAKIITLPNKEDPSACIYFNVDDECMLAMQNDEYQNIVRGRLDLCKFSSNPDDISSLTGVQKLFVLLDYNVLNIQPCDGECGEDGCIYINLTKIEVSPENYKADI